MHDLLGRRLSLAALQAAALEVTELPAPQRAAIERLAMSVRASVTELHEVLGVLRREHAPSRGMAAVTGLIEEFRTAGALVSVQSRGRPRPLPPPVDEAAYRVIEEGLTNAIRHAPGRPVSVTIAWEAGALLLTVVNASDHRPYAPGSGLAGLAGRLQQAGGGSSRRTQPARVPGPVPARRRPVQRFDRRPAARNRGEHQDVREPHPRQAGLRQPRPGRPARPRRGATGPS
jgi:signal transduction histidine kinase